MLDAHGRVGVQDDHASTFARTQKKRSGFFHQHTSGRVRNVLAPFTGGPSTFDSHANPLPGPLAGLRTHLDGRPRASQGCTGSDRPTRLSADSVPIGAFKFDDRGARTGPTSG